MTYPGIYTIEDDGALRDPVAFGRDMAVLAEDLAAAGRPGAAALLATVAGIVCQPTTKDREYSELAGALSSAARPRLREMVEEKP